MQAIQKHLGAKDNSFQYMRELHCRHSGAAHIYTHTHTHTHTHTLCVSANHAGEQNFRYVQPDCVNNRPVKQYIVRGPFATGPKQLKIINQS